MRKIVCCDSGNQTMWAPSLLTSSLSFCNNHNELHCSCWECCHLLRCHQTLIDHQTSVLNDLLQGKHLTSVSLSKHSSAINKPHHGKRVLHTYYLIQNDKCVFNIFFFYFNFMIKFVLPDGWNMMSLNDSCVKTHFYLQCAPAEKQSTVESLWILYIAAFYCH